MTAASRIRWGRIVIAAVLLEIAITAVVIPFALIFGNPLNPPADGRPSTMTPYLIAAAVGCAGLGFLFGRWVARAASSRRSMHGLLVGVTATVIYLALCALAPGGIAAVIAAYSAPMYALFNVLRVGGSWAGGISAARGAGPST